jgi:hypothetical protein
VSTGLRTERASSPSAALALGALAAALATLPAVKRVAAGVEHPGVVWLGLAGGTALVLGPVLALLRAIPRSSTAARAALLGVIASAVPLAWLGSLLKTGTNHRPLGAATYGMLALFVIGFAVLAAFRLLAWSERDPTSFRRRIGAGVTLLAVLALGLVMFRSLGADSARLDLLDGLRVVAAGAAAWFILDVPRVEAWARRAGGLLWVILAAAGLAASHGQIRDAIHERAPVLGGPTTWL